MPLRVCDIVVLFFYFATLLVTIYSIKNYLIAKEKYNALVPLIFYGLTIAIIVARGIEFVLEFQLIEKWTQTLNFVAVGLSALVGFSQAISMHEIKKKTET
jgi:hypothetical protein